MKSRLSIKVLSLALVTFFVMSALLIVPASAATYSENYRPQFHFTPPDNWMNDPNGMLYYGGEYHLFYQYYPYGTVWGPMHWGHAVSTDMVKWTNLPIGLYPDGIGDIFSGSAVVDWNNTSGFQTGSEKVMVAIFTHNGPSGQHQSIAYSNDKGRTWTKYEKNPVIPNPGIADFRDPKVFWHAATNKWVMVLAAHDRVKIYTSPNLKDWTFASDFGATAGGHGGVWECPDLFPLKVDGGPAEKWVMLVSINPGGPAGGSGTQYFIGDFNGTTFTNSNPDSMALWLDWGKDNYAGVTWSDSPDGRRNFIGWMSNWNYATVIPTTPWRSAMTAPRTLGLKTFPNGIFLVQDFISEINNYRGTPTTFINQTITPGTNIMSGLSSKQFEVIAEFQDSTATASEYGFKVRKGGSNFTTIGYNRSVPEIFVDRRFSGNVNFNGDFPNAIGQHMVAQDGKVKMRFLVDWSSVEVLGNDGIASISEQIFPDPSHMGIELYSIGGNVTLNSLTFYPISSNARPNIPAGNFSTNVGTFSAKSGTWVTTTEGRQGSSSGDGFAMSTRTGTNFTYSGNLRVGKGGAAGLVFRANSTATTGYVANVDAANGVVKLWKLGGGVLGEYKTTIKEHLLYPLKVIANGTNIKVYFNNGTAPVIDVTDSSYSSGYYGLNVWNGTSVFQNVNYSTNTTLPAAGFNTNLGGTWTTTNGTWSTSSTGRQGSYSGDAFYISSTYGSTDFVYEGDLKVTGGGAAGLVFRASSNGSTGYVANIEDNGDVVKLWRPGYGEIARFNTTIDANTVYKLKVVAKGSNIQVFFNNGASPVINVNDSTYANGYFGLNIWNGTAQFQNIYKN